MNKSGKLKKDNNRILEMAIDRNGTDNIFIQTSKDIEQFFQGITEEQDVSRNWSDKNGNALEFYKLNADFDNPFNNWINDQNYKMDFGSGHLIEVSEMGITVNLALLRAKGVSDGITMELGRKYTRNALKTGIKVYKEGTKSIYQEFIREIRLRTELTEIEL